MEAAIAQRVQYPSWVGCREFKRKPLGSSPYSQRVKEEKMFRGLALAHLKPDRRNDRPRSVSSEVSCSDKKIFSTVAGGKCSSFDEDLILKRKAEEVKP